MTPCGVSSLVKPNGANPSGSPTGDKCVVSPYGDFNGRCAVRISSVRDMQVLARARRRDLGLTQQEAADRAGVSRKWLVNFESGTASAVELSLVLRLFAALDVPLD